MVFAVDRVDLHRFAGLVIRSEVVLVGLLDIHARFMGEFVVSSLDQSQGWFGPDYIFESRVVDDESWAFGGEGREVLCVCCGGFPVEFGDCSVSCGSRHFFWSMERLLVNGCVEASVFECQGKMF